MLFLICKGAYYFHFFRQSNISNTKTMEENKIKDKEILKNVIEALHTNPKRLSEDLGYKSHNSIYNITTDTGTGKITPNLAERLINKFPDLRAEYLYTGKGEIFIDKKADNIDSKTLDSLREIPDLLRENNYLLKKLIFLIENKNF